MIDDGCAFEIGFMRAQHKPVMLLPFTEEPEKKRVMNLMLAQGATAFYDGNTELEILKTYDFNTNPAKPTTVKAAPIPTADDHFLEIPK